MKKSTITLALTAVLALSACGTSGSAEESPSTGTNRPAEASQSETSEPVEDAAAPDSAELPEESEPSSSVLSFGDAFLYDDGVQVTVGAPTPMTSGPYAIPENAKGSAFTVTIVNGTDAPFDPSMAHVTVQSGNTEAEAIFDSEGGYGGPPDTTLLPGREATYDVAFATSDASDIVLEMTPSFSHAPALYTTDGS